MFQFHRFIYFIISLLFHSISKAYGFLVSLHFIMLHHWHPFLFALPFFFIVIIFIFHGIWNRERFFSYLSSGTEERKNVNKKSKSCFVHAHIEGTSIDSLVICTEIDQWLIARRIEDRNFQKPEIEISYKRIAFANVPEMKHTPGLCTAASITASPRKPSTLHACMPLTVHYFWCDVKRLRFAFPFIPLLSMYRLNERLHTNYNKAVGLKVVFWFTP